MAKNNVAEVTFKHFSYKNQSKKHYANNRQLCNVKDQLNIGNQLNIDHQYLRLIFN